jgi:hypothetical protein
MSRLFRYLLLAGALIAIARYVSQRSREQQQPFFADAHRALARTPASVAPEAVMEPDEDSFVADVSVRGPFALEDDDAVMDPPFAAGQPAPKTETWSGRAIGS